MHIPHYYSFHFLVVALSSVNLQSTGMYEFTDKSLEYVMSLRYIDEGLTSISKFSIS